MDFTPTLTLIVTNHIKDCTSTTTVNVVNFHFLMTVPTINDRYIATAVI
ncbi:MAG: hypothetical protein K2I46_06280 [Clostridia bacterium]|nr:hypothetical protein [Clostridia bacterium]